MLIHNNYISGINSPSIRSTAKPNGGYEYEFLEVPIPVRFVCIICTKVLRDPHLTECCGQNFCESCLKNWITKSRKKKQKVCPHCQLPLKDILNKEKVRDINTLRIYCTYRKVGCEWEGELGDLNVHHNLDSDNGCGYVEVECPYSNGLQGKAKYYMECNIRRKDLVNHMGEECEYRPYTCEHCGHKDTYMAITMGYLAGPVSSARKESHYDQCPEYPLPCPNECGIQQIKRKDMDDHHKCCPLERLDCPFKDAGCTESIALKDMENHMEHNTQQHILKLFHAHQELMQSHQKLMQSYQQLKAVVENIQQKK